MSGLLRRLYLDYFSASMFVEVYALKSYSYYLLYIIENGVCVGLRIFVRIFTCSGIKYVWFQNINGFKVQFFHFNSFILVGVY